MNKTSNCVRLKNPVTGLAVKVHSSRDLNTNRNLAIKRLKDKIDL